MIENVYIPDSMKTSYDKGFFQALANKITRTSKSGKIEWTSSGPVVDGMNVSYQFMYPPIYGIDEEIERLNNPKNDAHVVVLTVAEIEFIQSKINGSNEKLEQTLDELLNPNQNNMTIDDIDPIKMEKLNKFINDNKNNV